MVRPPLVLAYHALGDLPPAQDPQSLMLPPRELRAHVEYLLRRRLAQLRKRREHSSMSQRAVVEVLRLVAIASPLKRLNRYPSNQWPRPIEEASSTGPRTRLL